MSIATRKLIANGLTFTADSAGEGDSVALLLHGFPESRASWRAQLPALAELGWQAVAPDLRGYGDSARPLGLEAYRIERLAEDVAGLFEALGAKQRILIGHDWGGAIAWHAALTGLPLDGLAILNAPHPARFRQALRTWDQRRRSWYIAFFLLPWLPEWLLTRDGGRALVRDLKRQCPRMADAALETLRRNILAPDAATAMLAYYRANALRLNRQPPHLAPVECPTLLLWGEDDPYLSPALAEGNEAFVRDLTVHRMPGVSHWTQQDAPAAVNRLIAQWARAKALAG